MSIQNKSTPTSCPLDFGRGDLEFPPTEVPIHFSPEKGQFPAACIDVHTTDQFWTASGDPLIQMDFALVDLEHLKLDGLLGHNFFMRYAVFCDFGSQEICLKPPEVA